MGTGISAHPPITVSLLLSLSESQERIRQRPSRPVSHTTCPAAGELQRMVEYQCYAVAQKLYYHRNRWLQKDSCGEVGLLSPPHCTALHCTAIPQIDNNAVRPNGCTGPLLTAVTTAISTIHTRQPIGAVAGAGRRLHRSTVNTLLAFGTGCIFSLSEYTLPRPALHPLLLAKPSKAISQGSQRPASGLDGSVIIMCTCY